MDGPYLVAISGLTAGTKTPIPPEGLTIGRAADNRLCLDDPTVSADHALMRLENGEMWVHVVRATNGIWVDGVAGLDLVAKHGSHVKFGISMFMYCAHADSSDALVVIIRDERDRRRQLVTERIDDSAGTDRAIYLKDVADGIVEAIECGSGIT